MTNPTDDDRPTFTLDLVEAYERELDDALTAAGVKHDVWHDEDGDEGWHITIEAGEERGLHEGGTQCEVTLAWWTRDDTWYRTWIDQHGHPSTFPEKALNDGAGVDAVAAYVKGEIS